MKAKNITLALCCLFATQCLPAQITLEHTYKESLNFIYDNAVDFTTIKYYVVDKDTYTMTIYDLDHSIYKTITLNIPPNTKLFGIDQLFATEINDDLLFEFYYTTSYLDSQNKPIYELFICNENMKFIQRFPGAYSIAILKTAAGSKLRAIKPDNNTDIYTLQKSGSNTMSPKAESRQYPYPNPAGASITIPYTIPAGVTTTISIFNAAGQLFETKKVDGTFNDLLLDTSHYPQGIYYYTYLTRSGDFIVK